MHSHKPSVKHAAMHGHYADFIDCNYAHNKGRKQGRLDDEKEAFFEEVQTVIDNIKNNKETIVMGHVKEYIRTPTERYEQTIGSHGKGELYAEGKIKDFCTGNNLAIMNT